MSGKKITARIGVGVALALAGSLPVAQAKAPSTDRPAVSYYTPEALRALDARWTAEAEAARFQMSRAIAALDARWNAEARAYGRR